MATIDVSNLGPDYDQVIADSIDHAKIEEMKIQYKDFLVSDTKLRAYVKDCFDLRSTSVVGDDVDKLEDATFMEMLTIIAMKGIRDNFPRSYEDFAEMYKEADGFQSAVALVDRPKGGKPGPATFIEYADARDQLWFFASVDFRVDEKLQWKDTAEDSSFGQSIQSFLSQLKDKLVVIKANQEGTGPSTASASALPAVKECPELDAAMKLFKIQIEVATRKVIRKLNPFLWQKDYHLLIEGADMAAKRAEYYSIDAVTKMPELFKKGEIEIHNDGQSYLVVDKERLILIPKEAWAAK